MPVISQSLADALRQILQALQLPFLFPSITFVAATMLLFPDVFKMDVTSETIVTITVTVILSYLLYACNVPIIRLVEGYSLDQTWFFQFTHWFEKRRYQALQDQITACNTGLEKLSALRDKLELAGLLTPEVGDILKQKEAELIAQRSPFQERLELRFPAGGHDVLPTALGNTIAAFEDYPWTRYSMDAVQLWPRLLPILEEKKFTAFVQGEKTIFDFLMNTGLVVTAVGLECLLLLWLRPSGLYLAGVVGLFFAAYVFYRGAIVAAQHWGGMVRVAFDLYRDDLRRALHLPEIPDKSLEKERELWQAISAFIVFGEDDAFPGFIYSSPPESKKGESSCAQNI